MKLMSHERVALEELTDWLRARFGSRIREVTLFGSRARGEGTEESDLDVLVVVDELDHGEWRDIAYFSGDLLTRHDVLVRPFALSTKRFFELRDRERRLIQEIERDGVRL